MEFVVAPVLEVGPWGAISVCSAECGGGTLTEVRAIEVNSDHGGEQCPEDLERSVECNTQPCPVDCMLSGWTNSGTCSTTCGGGVVRQIKTVLVMNAFGGKACDANQEQWTDCNTEACPVNCEWGQWTGWSPCSAACAEGTTDRTREIVVHKAHGGADCTGPDTESEPCMSAPCPVDGAWDEWSEWGECGQQCGEGYKKASRGILTAPAYGGKPLDGLPQKDATCIVKPCPIDCELGPWEKAEGKEGECTETCGGGVYKEVREIFQITLCRFHIEQDPFTSEKKLRCLKKPSENGEQFTFRDSQMFAVRFGRSSQKRITTALSARRTARAMCLATRTPARWTAR